MHTNYFNNFLVALMFLCCAHEAFGITLGQIDDFNDGGVAGWSVGGGAPQPANVNDTLQLATSGSPSGPGSNLIAFNQAQWTGNYLQAGVNGLLLDVTNPNNTQVNIRIGINGGGGPFVTQDVVVPANSTAESILFELTADNVTELGFTPGDLDATLAAVTELRILHNPFAISANTGAAQGASIGSPPFAAQVQFDNLTAVPEPTTLALGGMMVAIAVAPRRRSCQRN